MLRIASCICCHYPLENAICPNIRNTTQIVYAVKLRGRFAPLLNVARDSQNISSTWSHTLHEAVQTYDVEMICQRSIYSISVTNNHPGPEVQALHIAIWLQINIIAFYIVCFQDSLANTR